jgi:hypothetical protein
MPHAHRVLARRVALACAVVALPVAGATLRGAEGPPVQAPQLQVGDRWAYHANDGYRSQVRWDETYEIASITPEAITVKVAVKGAGVDYTRTEIWSAPGVMVQGALYEAETRRFDPPWIRYKFPMATGDSWSQQIRDPAKEPGPYGPTQSKVTVGGYEQVKTPAGTFNAIKLRYFLRLDDETFWRFPTECDYFVWYAPDPGVMVRAEKRSSWREKGGTGKGQPGNFGQRAVYELVSFTRGS